MTSSAETDGGGHAAFSCVVEQDPYLAAQSFIWLNCLLEIQRVPPERIFLHHTGLTSPDFLSWLESRRINLVKIEPFDPRSAHCNKLRQLETFADARFDRVVLMDCDTAWIGQEPLPHGGPVMAKVVHYANPPEAVLEKIFEAAGMAAPDWIPVSIPRGPGERRSDVNNCNGGLYILAQSIIPQLSAAWKKWALWCLDHPKLFGNFAIHADQVSFALAMRELGLTTEQLPMEWNFSIHVPAKQLPNVTPHVIHFHRQFDEYLKIKPVGLSRPDEAISRLNQHIDGFLNASLINSIFWDLRYRVSPELGSGVGSRGEILEQKRKWLGYALGAFENKTVIDVGCGDLETARTLRLQKYLGLDLSQQALALASAKRPDWFFAHLAVDQQAFPEADAVMCLDVLIHQKSAGTFESMVRRLAAAARRRLLVSGYNEPLGTSGIIAFHRPLVEALSETGLFSEISVIGRYRDCSLVVADKPRPEAHPRDISAADFNRASLLTHRPDLLRHLADLSRQMFSFYTAQFSRAMEYPWVAEKLEWVPSGGRVIDIGAGLNPLPLFLARRGVSVDCVDSHPVKRTPPVQPDWNEWGFFDYRLVHPNLRSHNADVLAFQPASPVDAVYSVSVIEHMPRATWSALLNRCRSWLKKKGRLLLTIDLVPGTQNLWNYSEGREVEPVGVHGTVEDMLKHLDRLGFKPMQTSAHQGPPGSRTDLYFIESELD